jgi:outer membrane protein, adhesin transport system
MTFKCRSFAVGLMASTLVLLQSSCSQTSQHKPQMATVNEPGQPNGLRQNAGDVTGSIANASASAATASTPSVTVTNLSEAVRRAVDWHPAIREALGQVRQQGEVIAEARAGYLPSVGGGINLGAENGSSGDWGPKFNLTATQMLYDFGKVSGKVEAETALRDARTAEFLASVDDVIRDTALAWVEVLRNDALTGVAREQISDVQSIGKLVEARTDSGASTRSDKLQAQARVQAAQSTALEIAGQKRRWDSTLGALLGGARATRMRANFPAALDRACTGSQPDWDTVPTVIAAKSRQREADARVKLARADMLPTLALEASSRVKAWDPSDDPEYVIGLTIKGDLYNGGAFQARQNAAKYAAQVSEAAVATGRFDSQKTWIESAGQVASMRALLRSLASRQPMMRETRNIYQAQFLDLGTRTLLDVLNADQELHAARFDEINTRYDLYKLNIECGYSAGRLRDIFGLSSEPPAERAKTAAGPAPKASASRT